MFRSILKKKCKFVRRIRAMKEYNMEEITIEEVNVYIKDCGDIKLHCMNDCPINSPWLSEEN